MGYRIVADEHVELPTRRYLRKLGHDVEWIGDVRELGLSSSDEEIAAYSLAEDRLVLTQDDDFFLELDLSDRAGILFQRDQSLSAREVDVARQASVHAPQPSRRRPVSEEASVTRQDVRHCQHS